MLRLFLRRLFRLFMQYVHTLCPLLMVRSLVSCLAETEIVDMLLEHHPLGKADMEINATLVFALSGLLDEHRSERRLPLRLFGLEFLLLVGSAHTTISFAATLLRPLAVSMFVQHIDPYICVQTNGWLLSI